MVVIADEAELVWAFRRARDEGDGRDRAALEILRAVTGEEISPKLVDVRPAGEAISPAWDALMASSDA